MELPTPVNMAVVKSFASQMEVEVPRHFWEQGFLGTVLGQVSIEELLTPGLGRRGLKRPAPPLGVCLCEVDVTGKVCGLDGSRQRQRTKIYAVVMTDRSPVDVQSRRAALT